MKNKHLFVALLTLPLCLGSLMVNAEDTRDIIASPDFDFRIDRDIQINLTSAPSGTGVVNVYYGYEFHDSENNIYYPDQKTRILHFKTTTTNQVKFQANKNWQYLIFEYVPTHAGGIEQYKKIDLTSTTQINLSL